MARPTTRPGLQRELCQVPITALAFYTSPSGAVFVLAGEDASLSIYAADGPSAELICCLAVFDQDQPVHGIQVDGQQCLVWGSSLLSVLHLGALETDKTVKLVAKGRASDWIYDAALSPWDPSLAVLATAHNEVVPLRRGVSDSLVFGALTSPSRPMLYNAHLSWLSPTTVLVAAGTVFGDIVVWKYLFARDDSPAEYVVLFNLSGHEGSIYGVDMSPEILLPDGRPMRLLASCSDDRTIRVWDVTEREGTDKSIAQGSNMLGTGFRSTFNGQHASEQPQDAVMPIAVIMGHASRIWGVKFGVASTPSPGHGSLAIYSFGEDSTTQRWRFAFDVLEDDRVTGRLAHSQTYSLHQGKHLWAGAVLCRRDERTMIVTGGGDSKINIVREPDAECTPPGAAAGGDGIVAVDMQDMVRSLPAHQRAEDKSEMISRYDFLLNGQVLALSNLGRLFLSFPRADGLAWRQVEVDDGMTADLRFTYTIRTTSNGSAILGTSNGDVFYFQLPGRISRVARVPGRIIDINRLSPSAQQPDSSACVQVLVHIQGSPDSQYIALDASGKVLVHEAVKGLDGRFVATSSAMVGNLLIIGSRRGWLCLLARQDGGWRPMVNFATRSRDAITSIVPLPSASEPASDLVHLLLTSRDGKYRIYQFQRGAPAQLHLLHENAPPFGPMIEGAWFTSDRAEPELILYGFRSKDFVVWNETRREEVATVECGGAHRKFRLGRSGADPSRCWLAFTRTSKLYIYSQSGMPHQTLKAGTHGREIRAMSSNGRYLASGAEDTLIQIWAYREEQGPGRAEMQCLASMKAHASGIQELHWFGDEYLFSSGGNEELFVWRIRKLPTYGGLAVVCEGVFADKSPLGDLRIMDFDISGIDGGGGMLVTLAFSNSTVKTYRYTTGGGFALHAQGCYTGACLTQTRHLGLVRGQLWLCTTSTDGHVALWKTAGQVDGDGDARRHVLAEAVQMHQSSIKSIDLLRVGPRFRLMTGGDDNAVGSAVVSENEGGDGYTVSTRGVVRRAHGAAVNGVVLLRRGGEGDDDEVVGVSVSNDQRVKMWRMTGRRGQEVALVASAYSAVADPGSVARVGHGDDSRVVLGGVGVEVWRWAGAG
ncbi:hypothetical protein RJ55_08348 [Drechmeria coniospora]|nr:hypothetical protein RJ55_08348 [Drechmeria coniospora]